MSKARAKGTKGQRDFARLTDGKVLVYGGQPGPDVQARGLLWEVKRREDSYKGLYKLLAGPSDALALRSDRRGWLVVLPLETFLEGWKPDD